MLVHTPLTPHADVEATTASVAAARAAKTPVPSSHED
jgi:hypothetical protein